MARKTGAQRRKQQSEVAKKRRADAVEASKARDKAVQISQERNQKRGSGIKNRNVESTKATTKKKRRPGQLTKREQHLQRKERLKAAFNKK